MSKNHAGQDELMDYVGRPIEWLQDNCLDLRCVDMPTGGGDSDVGWEVIEHHMGKPHERRIGFGMSALEAMKDAGYVPPAPLPDRTKTLEDVLTLSDVALTVRVSLAMQYLNTNPYSDAERKVALDSLWLAAIRFNEIVRDVLVDSFSAPDLVAAAGEEEPDPQGALKMIFDIFEAHCENHGIDMPDDEDEQLLKGCRAEIEAFIKACLSASVDAERKKQALEDWPDGLEDDTYMADQVVRYLKNHGLTLKSSLTQPSVTKTSELIAVIKNMHRTYCSDIERAVEIMAELGRPCDPASSMISMMEKTTGYSAVIAMVNDEAITE